MASGPVITVMIIPGKFILLVMEEEIIANVCLNDPDYMIIWGDTKLGLPE